jgi:ABC-type oligopeptide transport system ATPase subunit
MDKQIGVIKKDKIEVMAKTDETYDSPKSEYTKKLTAAIRKGIPGKLL